MSLRASLNTVRLASERGTCKLAGAPRFAWTSHVRTDGGSIGAERPNEFDLVCQHNSFGYWRKDLKQLRPIGSCLPAASKPSADQNPFVIQNGVVSRCQKSCGRVKLSKQTQAILIASEAAAEVIVAVCSGYLSRVRLCLYGALFYIQV